MDLKYEAPTASLSPNGVATPQYGGNISQITWQVRGREKQAYTLQYDAINRMTSAAYSDINASNTVTGSNRYDEKLTYDMRGNINTLQRWGLNGACTWGMIDNLTYNYGSNGYNITNKLNTVTESSDATRGFKTISNGSAYSYDNNGNMTADPNKGITGITYNHMNLPITITFTGSRSIAFLYDAGGNKLSKTVVQSGVTQYKQDYVGGIEYRTASNVTTLEAIYHAEGRVTTINVSLKYEYALKDHLGNTRLMFSDKNNDGLIQQSTGQEASEVTQENHYYSFGLQMEGTWMNTPSVLDTKYTYNGKELNDDFGLGLLDYGFRLYDPAIGRFTTIDPLAELFEHQSPYVYADNNPINFIDFMGLGGDDPNKPKDGGILPTVVVTATRLPSKSPRTNAWNNWVQSSYDRTMGITPNQWQNPYKTEEQRQSDRTYAANLIQTADNLAEFESFIITFAFTVEESLVANLLRKTVIRQGVKQVVKKKGINKTVKLTTADSRAIKSLEDLILKHQQKLKNWIENPSKYDDKGFLKNAPADRIEKIIESRIRHLEHEIKTFQDNIKKVLEKY